MQKRTAALLSYAIYDVGKSLYFPCGIGYFGGGGFWYLQCCRWSNNYVQLFNGAMSSSTQRYITFELGRGDFDQLQKVFQTSVNIHLLVALLILFLGETIGLWFFYEKMVIPASRMTAAFWVYQFSIITMMVMIVSVPYNAAIIAHEKMSIFAYISILEVLLKLGIVYLLYLTRSDKLIMYAALLCATQLLIRIVYGHYCSCHFKEVRYYWGWDLKLFKEMLYFGGWNLWGGFATVLFPKE